MNIESSLFSHLPYLAVVVNTASFTRAAEELHVSQAAVSYQIRQLEEKLGVTLIVRQSGSQIKISNAAKQLAKEYRACEKRLRVAIENIDPQGFKGVLRLTAPVDFASIVMPSVLAELQNLAPELRVELDVSDTVVNFLNSDYDFAIRVDNMGPDLEHELIAISQKSLVASPAYLHARGEPRSLSDLLEHSLLTRSVGSNASWQQLLSQAGIAFADIKQPIVLGNTFALAEGAKANLGLAILPNFVMSEAVENKTLCPVLNDYFTPLISHFHLSYLPTTQAGPMKALLMQALSRIIFEQPRFAHAFIPSDTK